MQVFLASLTGFLTLYKISNSSQIIQVQNVLNDKFNVILTANYVF